MSDRPAGGTPLPRPPPHVRREGGRKSPAPSEGGGVAEGVAPSPQSKPIRVLIVDDSVLMRQAVRRLLTADPGIEVVDVARDGLEALAKVEKLKPDVLTMDVEMPHMDGLSALKMLMERYPRPGRHAEQPDGGRRRGDRQGAGARAPSTSCRSRRRTSPAA